MPVVMERSRHRLNALEASLRALNPEAVLERGYAVVRQNGKVLESAIVADVNAPIVVQLKDGELTANIASVAPKDGNG